LDEYMYEDVQLFEDSTKSGSLFIQLAKPLAKIREEIDQIVAQHQELAKAEEEAKKQKKKAAKKPKEPVRIDPSKLVPLPKKEKVIVPPQLPKPVSFSSSFSRGNKIELVRLKTKARCRKLSCSQTMLRSGNSSRPTRDEKKAPQKLVRRGAR
jgi:hypothetical protein